MCLSPTVSPIKEPQTPATSTSATATCCPAFARFEGSPNKRINVDGKPKPAYYAYDDRTNIASRPGGGEYWFSNPVGTHPGNRRTRDGSSWISVPVGEVAEVEIHLDPNKYSCATNCSFEIDKPNVAKVLTSAVAGRKGAFRIQGLGRGEATLIARCNDKDIGWFQIWCDNYVSLNLDCFEVQYPGGDPTLPVNHTELTNGLNATFRQALIQFNVTWKRITLSPETIKMEQVLRAESAKIGNSPKDLHFRDGSVLQSYIHSIVPKASRSRGMNGYIFHKPTGSSAVTVPANGKSSTSFWGVVVPVGDRAGWSYNDTAHTFAHEVGHMLGLGHPWDKPPEIPAHLKNNLTNGNRVMANDPQNLMGYNSNRSAAFNLLIDQCIKCRRK